MSQSCIESPPISSGEPSPTFGHANANFSNANFDRPYTYKESISEEMNNDNDLILHSMTKFACPKFKEKLAPKSSAILLWGRIWDVTFCFVPKFRPTIPSETSSASVFL